MDGFYDLDHKRQQSISDLYDRIDRLTVDDLFQPIASLSTTDKQVVELLVGDRVMHGFFSTPDGCWMVAHGTQRIPEGLYPTHWRKLRPE